MNTPVSFPIAKLLKEKGFENESDLYYTKEGELLYDRLYPSLQRTKPKGYYDAPTIAEVIMWLYEKHGIWVHTCYMPETGNWWWDCYKYKKENGLLNEPAYSHKFNHQSPTEAYEAAINYILKNLI